MTRHFLAVLTSVALSAPVRAGTLDIDPVATLTYANAAPGGGWFYISNHGGSAEDSALGLGYLIGTSAAIVGTVLAASDGKTGLAIGLAGLTLSVRFFDVTGSSARARELRGASAEAAR